MALGRLSVKVGKAGKGAAHAAYIAREGKYANREQGERLEAAWSGNMPPWAAENPGEFWRAADAYERKNGSVYREHEIALPRELNEQQRRELVERWISEELGTRPYQVAIHETIAADGQREQHAHLMFSDRALDGIDRDPEQFFKRYNANNPEWGGARKLDTGIDREARKLNLKEQRLRWQGAANNMLEQAGSKARISMRSNAERGINWPRERKQLPSEWRDPAKRAHIIDLREAKREAVASMRERRALIPDTAAELYRLEHHIDLDTGREDLVVRHATPETPITAGPAMTADQVQQAIIETTRDAKRTRSVTPRLDRSALDERTPAPASPAPIRAEPPAPATPRPQPKPPEKAAPPAPTPADPTRQTRKWDEMKATNDKIMAKKLAERAVTAAELYQRGGFTVSAPLAEFLKGLHKSGNDREQREAAAAKAFANPEARKNIEAALQPHKQKIDREQELQQGRVISR